MRILPTSFLSLFIIPVPWFPSPAAPTFILELEFSLLTSVNFSLDLALTVLSLTNRLVLLLLTLAVLGCCCSSSSVFFFFLLILSSSVDSRFLSCYNSKMCSWRVYMCSLSYCSIWVRAWLRRCAGGSRLRAAAGSARTDHTTFTIYVSSATTGSTLSLSTLK